MRSKFFVGGIALGASTMYMMDPQAGPRRRSLARDKAVHLSNKLAEVFGKRYRDLRNRAQGVIGEVRATARIEEVPNAVLVERVRSQLGHIYPHAYAHAISVQADDGHVFLRGKCPPDGVSRLLDEVSLIPGVVSVKAEVMEAPLPKEGAFSSAAGEILH